MSLPPGFLDELRSRLTLSTVVGRKVAWDMRKSSRSKGDYWAPCPFHQEKSASFHADDKKGFYYCFGCHAKGDAIRFVQETENIGFMEAITLLAQEAGIAMPAYSPQNAAKTDRTAKLIAIMEEAARFFRLQLQTGAGAEARDYLNKRGLTPEALERWSIGWAPDKNNALLSAFEARGTPPDLPEACGLIAKNDQGRLYDRFRARIIFPIRDGRGRIISFGGRSLDPMARAKYLNGPETELFSKGRHLFNYANARQTVGKPHPLIVAEGYMDVIALSEAGFKTAVAPLGTAITEEQLHLMWRCSPEPVIALDGDEAGLRAAMRVMDLALPLLETGKSLRFVLLPHKQDPDDVIKSQGPAAMQQLIDSAIPMVNLLWQRETGGKVFDSPERKAALDRAIHTIVQKIRDPALRRHYEYDLKSLRWDLFRPRPAPRTPFKGYDRLAPLPPLAGTRSSFLAQAGEDDANTHLRLSVILAGLCLHPYLIPDYEPRLACLQVQDPHHALLQQLLLSAPDHTTLQQQAGDSLQTLLAHPFVQLAPPVREPDNREQAKLCLDQEFAKLEAYWHARQEMNEALEDLHASPDEGLTTRLRLANKAKRMAGKGPKASKNAAIIAPNGVEIDREEHDLAQKTWAGIDFTRGGKQPR